MKQLPRARHTEMRVNRPCSAPSALGFPRTAPSRPPSHPPRIHGSGGGKRSEEAAGRGRGGGEAEDRGGLPVPPRWEGRWRSREEKCRSSGPDHTVDEHHSKL